MCLILAERHNNCSFQGLIIANSPWDYQVVFFFLFFLHRYMEFSVPKFLNASLRKIIGYRKKSDKCLSANLLSDIHMLINPNLYVKTTYLNLSQRLSMFINVYCSKGTFFSDQSSFMDFGFFKKKH